jgi:transcriptional regulator with XRE-family HTH domain
MTRKNSTLGSLIRGLRRQKKWTLREMSERVGIPLSTLAKVEQDKLSLTYDKLQQFTTRLGLTMTEFLAEA